MSKQRPSSPRVVRKSVRIAAWTGLIVASLALGCVAAIWAKLTPAPAPDPADPRPQPQSVELTIAGAPVRVHALPTGTVRIKHCHRQLCGPEQRSYRRRFFDILRDDRFVEPMPIWTYLIEHPAGRFLIDTGGDTAFADPDSWSCDPVSGRINRSILAVDVRAGERLGERLAALDLEPAQLEAAIITHLHVDHTGGVAELDVPVYLGARDLDAARDIGATLCRFVTGAQLVPLGAAEGAPRPGDAGDAQLGPGHALTKDGRLRVYPTPGHTPGSLTVRLESDQGDLWFIGDTSFDERHLDPQAPTAGIHFDMAETRALQGRLQALARTTAALMLPAHDDDVGPRLRAFADRRGPPAQL